MKLFFILSLVLSSVLAQALQITRNMSFPGHVEIHVQPQVNELDLLFVVDNSGSMIEHQQNLIHNLNSLTTSLQSSAMSLHVGVITTDVDEKGFFKGSVKVVNNQMPDFSNILQKNLDVGTFGSGYEQPFNTVSLALSPSSMAFDHPDFYRSQASLAIVVLTDADDQSSLMTTQQFTGFLQALKPQATQTQLHSIQVLDSQCALFGMEKTGSKLSDAVKLMGGMSLSLCAQDFAQQLKNLGQGVAKMVREVPLTTLPDYNSIQVTYGSSTLVAGDIHHGWVYDSVRNMIILGDQINWSAMNGNELIISFIPADWK